MGSISKSRSSSSSESLFKFTGLNSSIIICVGELGEIGLCDDFKVDLKGEVGAFAALEFNKDGMGSLSRSMNSTPSLHLSTDVLIYLMMSKLCKNYPVTQRSLLSLLMLR